jgi:hypothetical protein
MYRHQSNLHKNVSLVIFDSQGHMYFYIENKNIQKFWICGQLNFKNEEMRAKRQQFFN